MTVQAAANAGWVPLDETKTHLNLSPSSTTHDDEVQAFINRAVGAVEEQIGVIKPPTAALVEYHVSTDRRSSVRLSKQPVLTVDSVSVYGTVLAKGDLDTGTDGWYLEEYAARNGLILHTSKFPVGALKVTYMPGRDPIHEDIKLATLELIRHFWQTQRGNSGRPGVFGDETDVPANRNTIAPHAMGFAFPNRVSELLRPYMPVPVA